jgi:hypothetical protein
MSYTRGDTHWVGCWDSHWDCRIAELEKRLREATALYVKHMACADVQCRDAHCIEARSAAQALAGVLI